MHRKGLMLLAVIPSLYCVSAIGFEDIRPDRFDLLHALLKPSDGQGKYMDEIPWMSSLWEARKRAAAEGKPLFVFASTRTPLGEC